MREKDFNTGLRGVLFEAKHYARMGPAIWLYGWLVLRQTHQCHGVGYVLDGTPITYREIESETGFDRRRWRRGCVSCGAKDTYRRTTFLRDSVPILEAKKYIPIARTLLTLRFPEVKPRRRRIFSDVPAPNRVLHSLHTPT